MAEPYRSSGGDSGRPVDATSGADITAAVALATPQAAAQIGSEGREPALTLRPATGIMGANPANRKKYLLDLVSDLSLDEIWMLQKRLAGLDLRTDIFSRLPPELQILIADELGPSDLGCCLQVSSRWRQALLHESMLKKLARRCFPSLLEYIDVVHNLEQKNEQKDEQKGKIIEIANSSPDTLVAQIFTDTAKQYALRAQGRFSYVFRHCKFPPAALAFAYVEGQTDGLERTMAREPSDFREHLTWLNAERHPSEQTEGTTSDDPQTYMSSISHDIETYMSPEYAYGRLAWESISASYVSFIVDDLRTGKRAILNVTNNVARGYVHIMCAFGDRLLVTNAGTSIMAWDFISGVRFNKSIPAQIDTVATLGNAVYILSQGNIFVWRTGGPVRDVDMAGLDPRFRQPDRDGRLPSYFLLDPLNRSIFYLGNYEVVGGDNGLSGELCVHLHKFEKLKYVETFTHGLPFSNFAFPQRIIGTNARRDSRGLFSVATWRAGKGTPGWKQSSNLAVLDRIGSLSFNIYTHKFTVQIFPLSPQSPTIGPDHFHTITTHIWNNQLMALVDRHRDAVKAKMRVAKPLLMAFEDEDGEESRCLGNVPFSALPLYVSTPLPAHEYDEKTPSTLLENSAIIKPERRRQIKFHEINRGTAAAWLQDDDDWATNGCILRFGLDVVRLPPGLENEPIHIRQYSLEGDDDFLVMHYDREFTVWCFNDALNPTRWEAYMGSEHDSAGP